MATAASETPRAVDRQEPFAPRTADDAMEGAESVSSDDESTESDEDAPPPPPPQVMPARNPREYLTKRSTISAKPSHPGRWFADRRKPDDEERDRELRQSFTPQRMPAAELDSSLWQARNQARNQEQNSTPTSSDDEGDICQHGHHHGHAHEHVDGQKEPKTPAVGKKDLGKGAWFDGLRRFHVGNDNYHTKGKVRRDGRLCITVKETQHTGYLAKALGAAAHVVQTDVDALQRAGKSSTASLPRGRHTSLSAVDTKPKTKLNIVIMLIGSRGDIQPFLKVGKVLKEQHGHRVRMATHPVFRDIVEKDSGLEFFSIGGDPSELMSFMVKNPGMIPTLDTVRAGDIGKRRQAMAEMFDGFWRSCIQATDDETDTQNLKMLGNKAPFVADAIIANPPSFAHMHCAEALGIPLHLMFTFPYTPTQAFPHPLTSIKKSNVDPGYSNFISYPLVEMMVWQGLGDLINAFRVKTLGLDPVSTLWAPGATYRLHVPFTYMWSPSLVPKPADWGPEIDISGFVFLDLASKFKPPQALVDFIEAGEPPIYIGFGSIVVDDADTFTELIFKAVKLAGVRALVSRGWGGFGSTNTPDNVYMLDNVPHDWLFPRVSACVHHGGAGTTAIALKCGKPTLVAPFFGDQHFWGSMIGKAGVGPPPIPYKHLTAEKLAEGIKYCLTDEAKAAAQKIAHDIEIEGDGARNAVHSFHKNLQRGSKTLKCSILPDKIAAWELKGTHVRLSPQAADILVDGGHTSWKKLRLLRNVEWNDFEGPGEPVTGVAGYLAGRVESVFLAAGSPGKKKEKHAEINGTNGTSSGDGAALEPVSSTASPAVATGLLNGDSKQGKDSNSASSTKTKGLGSAQHRETGKHVINGIGDTATAIARTPVDLSVALAQGFHNAPRLYGDDTVRKPKRITGIRSGLHAARSEFTNGIYDAFTGVFTLPVHEAKKSGAIGFVKGFGMGLTGLVLKNVSAVVGPFGYTAKGLIKQAERSKDKGPRKMIRRARIAQGQRETNSLTMEQRRELSREVVQGWFIIKELWQYIDDWERQNGLAGQLDRAFLDTSTLFNDIGTAKVALNALKKGDTVDHLLHPDRPPRKSVGKRNSKAVPDPQVLEPTGSATFPKDLKMKNGKPNQSPATKPIKNDVFSGAAEAEVAELGEDHGLRLVQTSI